MELTADMIITRRGTILPLDQRRRDALANFAVEAAKASGIPAQRWARETWTLKDYEAKDLLRGNASEPVWERILKHKNGGWPVALPILGAVIGHGIEDFITQEQERLSRERKATEDREAGLGEVARHLRSSLFMGRDRSVELGVGARRARGERRG